MGLVSTSLFDLALSGLNFSSVPFSAGLRPELNDLALSGLVVCMIGGIFVGYLLSVNAPW
jgi:hypothetical protein